MQAVSKMIFLALAILTQGVGPVCAAQRLVPSSYTTIQAAIIAASNGDEIILATGTYSGAGNRDLTPMGKAITIRSTDPTDPDVVAATIIDGESTYRAFYIAEGETATTILEGLTLQHCRSASGGAIKCYYAYPTIRYCRFIDNAVSGSDYLINGGALSIEGDTTATVTLSHCYFSANTCSNWGGAIYAETGLAMTNCVVAGNRSGNYGGGIYARNGDLTLDHCTFTGNYAAYFGGGIRLNGGTLTLTSSIFWDNTVADGGDEVSLMNAAEATLSYCDIEGDGAGMYVFAEDDCTITSGSGNLTGDPKFTQAGVWNGLTWQDGTYTLRAGSPGIDTGDPAFSGSGQTDLAGNPRLHNTRTDRGAYEKQQSPITIGSLMVMGGSSASGNMVMLRGTFNTNLQTTALQWALAEQIHFIIGPYEQTLSTTGGGYRQIGTRPFYMYQGSGPGITMMMANISQGTIMLMARGMSLTGITNPVTVSIETLGSEQGEYSGQGQTTVPRLSLKFMKDYADTLTLDSATVSGSGSNASLSLRGGIAFAATPATLVGQTFTLYWGDEVVVSFPSPGENFRKVGAMYMYSKSSSNTSGKVSSATINLDACTYSISVRGLTINDRSGTVPLRLVRGSFDETVYYTFR